MAALQIVLTVALLAGAALLVRTARNLDSVRPGYDTENVLAMTVTSVQGNKWKEFHQQALERVAAVPGVRNAAFAWGVPLTGNKWSWRRSRFQVRAGRRPSPTRLRCRSGPSPRTISRSWA